MKSSAAWIRGMLVYDNPSLWHPNYVFGLKYSIISRCVIDSKVYLKSKLITRRYIFDIICTSWVKGPQALVYIYIYVTI